MPMSSSACEQDEEEEKEEEWMTKRESTFSLAPSLFLSVIVTYPISIHLLNSFSSLLFSSLSVLISFFASLAFLMSRIYPALVTHALNPQMQSMNFL